MEELLMNIENKSKAIEGLKKTAELQNNAIREIHKQVFLNENIPAFEREKILNTIASVIRL